MYGFYRNNMTILQIGTNDGNDHVFEYIKHNHKDIEKIILIDANPECLSKAKEQYEKFSQTIFLNYAIVPFTTHEQSTVTLFLPKNNDFNSHASLNPTHLERHGHSFYDGIIVPAISFDRLYNMLNLSIIDRLYIDVEGLDIDILQTIDLANVDIKYICFEFIHSDGPLSFGGPKLNNYKSDLESMGYSLSSKEYNIIAIKNR